MATLLRAAVRSRASILFAGSPGTGKTTLLSCCAAELDPSLRVVIAEEVFEADVLLPNVAGARFARVFVLLVPIGAALNSQLPQATRNPSDWPQLDALQPHVLAACWSPPDESRSAAARTLGTIGSHQHVLGAYEEAETTRRSSLHVGCGD